MSWYRFGYIPDSDTESLLHHSVIKYGMSILPTLHSSFTVRHFYSINIYFCLSKPITSYSSLSFSYGTIFLSSVFIYDYNHSFRTHPGFYFCYRLLSFSLTLSSPLPAPKMELSTQNAILHHYEKSLSWKQKFYITHDDQEVDLSLSIGPDAVTPSNAPDQPNHFDFTSKYRFPKQFDSIDKIKSLQDYLKDHCLIGAKFALSHGVVSHKFYKRFSIRCSRYRNVEELLREKNFKDGKYVQEGVTRVTHKRSKCSKLSSLELLGSKTEIKEIRASKSSIVSPTKQNQPEFRRTNANRAKNVDTRCHCCINIFFYYRDSRFYLDTNTDLQHSFHHYQSPEDSNVKRSSIDDEQNRLITILSNAGISPSKIATILESIHDADGLYDKKMISNIIQQHQLLNETSLGITHDMTSAQRAMKYLDRYVIFYLSRHTYN